MQSYATTYLLQTDNRSLFNLRLQMLLDALEPRVGLQISRVAGAEMVWLGQMAAEHVVGCYAKRDGRGHAAAGVGAGVEHRHGGGWMFKLVRLYVCLIYVLIKTMRLRSYRLRQFCA